MNSPFCCCCILDVSTEIGKKLIASFTKAVSTWQQCFEFDYQVVPVRHYFPPHPRPSRYTPAGYLQSLVICAQGRLCIIVSSF